MADYEVNIAGVLTLRLDLRALDRAVTDGLGEVLEDVAATVARRAATLAPRRSGRLAASYEPFTAGGRSYVRSNLPYAAVVEYGGTIQPRGAPIRFARSLPVTRAAEREASTAIHRTGEMIEQAADRHGWT